MSKLKNACRLIISSSDARWNIKNEINMIHRLKKNNNVIIITSDSGEEIEDRSWFLKGGAVAALWSSIVNYFEVYCMHKQKRG